MPPFSIKGRFQVLRELGRGGMGLVYLVRDRQSDREVALKLLAARAFSESGLRHFEQEFLTLTGLSHPNLVEVYEFGRAPLPGEGEGREVPFFTMEYLSGQPLRRAFAPGPVPLDRLFACLAQIGEALAYLHSRDVIHRDIKPSNIFVLGDGEHSRIKLLDFGLATRGSAAGGDRLRGTAAYLAPEATRGDRVDPRADLYALGCVIYELLTGRPPFVGSSESAVLRAHLTEPPLPPSRLNPAVPAKLERLVLTLLEKDPGLRPSTAGEFLRELEEAAGRPLGVESPASLRVRVLGAGFVGRGEELAWLREAWRDAARGRPRALWLVGEAGVGKSRLVRELRIHAQLEGLEVFEGRPDDLGGALWAALHRACAERGIAPPPASSEALSLFGLVEQLAMTGPLVLAIEDLHRASPMEIESCRALAAAVATRGEGIGVFLVLTSRGAPETGRLAPFEPGGRSSTPEVLRLQPFTAEEVEQMLRAMLGWPSIPRALLERVLLHTRGNPLLIEELMALLVEEGHLAPGRPQLGELPALEAAALPERVRDVLGRRLERLAPEARRALEAAAVWGGDRLEPDAIAALSGMKWERAVRELGNLEQAHLLQREDDPSGAPLYRWAPPALAELVLERMDPEQARRYHATAASYIERRGPGTEPRTWAALAEHARAAGRAGRAIEAFRRAAELAADHPNDSLRWLTRALETARERTETPPSALAELYAVRAEARWRMADVAGAEEDARWWLACAEKAAAPRAIVAAHRFLATLARWTGRDAHAEAHAEDGLRRARDAGLADAALALELERVAARAAGGALEKEDLEKLQALRERAAREGHDSLASQAALREAELAWDRGDLRAVEASLAAARAHLEATGSPAPETLEMAGRALQELRRGSWPAAAEWLEQLARRVASSEGELAGLGWMLRAGALRVETGDAERARTLLGRVRELAEQRGGLPTAARATLALARLALQQGRHDEALALAAAAQRSTAAPRAVVWGAALLVAELRLLMGDTAGARHVLERAQLPETNALAGSRLEVERVRLHGDLDFAQGTLGRARRAYQEAAFLARRLGDRRSEASLLVRLGEIHLAHNEYERARTASRRGLERIEESGLPREEAQLRLLRARVELARPGGDVMRARADVQAALERLRRLGEPELLWQSEYLLGRTALRLGREEEAASRIRRAYRYLEAQRRRMGGRPHGAFIADPRRRELYEDWRRLKGPAAASAASPDEASTIADDTAEYARLQRENRDLHLLLEAIGDLEAALDDPPAFAERLLEAALQLADARRGWLELRLPGAGQPLSRARGEPEPAAIQAARSVWRDGAMAGEGEPSGLGPHHRVLVLPSVAGPLGVLLLERERAEGACSPAQVALATQLAERAGQLLGRASQWGELERELERLRRVNEDLERTLRAQQEALAQAREELSVTRSSFEMRYRFEELVGATEAMQRVYQWIERLAPKKLPVLITGESGTGKELIARALHARSDRSGGPFFTVNCAALNPTLLESELFGHRKGAFTGADRDKPGYFELAHTGTLFLDEIGEMSEAMQAKLLRAIERGEILPVGGEAPVHVDVRIVSATHRDLEALVREGKFREDLYYRIHVARIHVPPLRERRDDIPLLVDHFLTRLAEDEGQPKREIEPEAVRYLMSLPWPGNVRELQHQLLRVAALARGSTLTLRDVKRYTHAAAPHAPEGGGGKGEMDVATLQEMERRQIVAALERAGGNKTRAAKLLGIDRATLFRKLRRLGL